MNQYVTGNMIKLYREAKKITQAELAHTLGGSDKAVSKWETGRSYPDISLIEPLARALGLSPIELLSGESVKNRNRSFNMSKTKVYVCPICGNLIFAAGEAVISCCGVNLPPLDAETPGEHCPYPLSVEVVEDEYFVSIEHPMEKSHYISFMASVAGDRVEIAKLYPEGPAQARFKIRQTEFIYYYCNKHGLYMKKLG